MNRNVTSPRHAGTCRSKSGDEMQSVKESLLKVPAHSPPKSAILFSSTYIKVHCLFQPLHELLQEASPKGRTLVLVKRSVGVKRLFYCAKGSGSLMMETAAREWVKAFVRTLLVIPAGSSHMTDE